MERLLYLESNTALFQLSAARDKQFTFLLACGHVSLFGVQKVCLTHREQSEKGGTHWTITTQKKNFNMGWFWNILISDPS